jgi:hypothetical protein
MLLIGPHYLHINFGKLRHTPYNPACLEIDRSDTNVAPKVQALALRQLIKGLLGAPHRSLETRIIAQAALLLGDVTTAHSPKISPTLLDIDTTRLL